MYNENWIYSFCVSLTSKTWAWQELNDTDVFMSEKKFFSLNLKKGTKYKPNGERFFCEIRASWIVNWSFKRFSTLIIHFKQMNDDKAPTVQHFPFFFQNRNFCILLYHREHLLRFALLRWLVKIILYSEVFHVNNE